MLFRSVELNITFNIIEKNYITQKDTITNIFAEQTIQEGMAGPLGSTRGQNKFEQVMKNTNSAVAAANSAIENVLNNTTTTDSADAHNLQETIAFGQG